MLIEIILGIVVFVELLLGLSVLINNPRDFSNGSFALLSFSGAVWALSNYMTDATSSIYWLHSSYSLGAIVICIGLVWTIIITENKPSWKKIYLICLIGLFFSYQSSQIGFIAQSYGPTQTQDIFLGKYGTGLLFYSIYYLVFAALIIRNLYRQLKHSADENESRKFICILIGAAITLTVSALSSLFLPIFFSYLNSSLDSIGFLLFLILIIFSIKKYQLFNLKIIVMEIILSTLLIFMLMRLFFADTLHDLLIEGSVFLIIMVLGILLIQNVLQNIRQRQDIQNLTNDLKKALIKR